MNPRLSWRLGAIAALLASLPGRAAAPLPEVKRTTVDVEERIVELPPMIVMETAKTPPWLHVRTQFGEYLSRCSPGTTREFVNADIKLFQLLRALVPESFMMKTDHPQLVILDRMELKPAGDAVMQDMMNRTNSGDAANDGPVGSRVPTSRVRALPNLRIDDRDMSVLFAYIEERNYDGDRMVITPGFVRFMMERRAPDLPTWLIEGVVRVFAQSDFLAAPISVRQSVWLSFKEGNALQRYPEWPRTLLPMNELFSIDALRGPENQGIRRAETWGAQCALFFRWALDPGHAPARDAFWRLATRSGQEPITEEVFTECFGFGFSEMRDRLSDYLPEAVKEPFRVDPGRIERPPAFEVRPAPKELIARLLGEWERVEIFHVKAGHPQFTPQYALQARRTLRKAYDLGDRDPRLLAAMGLCEIDAGEEGNAPFFLERAVAAGVSRPRAYYELARLRYAELTRGQPATQRFAAAEITRCIEPLRSALPQNPPLPEAVALLANAWLRCDAAPPAEDFAALLRATEQFPARPALIYWIALLHARHGRVATASALVTSALRFPVGEEGIRTRLLELKNALAQIPK